MSQKCHRINKYEYNLPLTLDSELNRNNSAIKRMTMGTDACRITICTLPESFYFHYGHTHTHTRTITVLIKLKRRNDDIKTPDTATATAGVAYLYVTRKLHYEAWDRHDEESIKCLMSTWALVSSHTID